MQNNALAETKQVDQDHDPTSQSPAKHARNTHDGPRRPLKNDQHLQAITIHRSESWKLKKSSSGRRDGGTDGGRDGPHKFARRALATEESSRARSFARSHARNANENETEIDFPVRGKD